MPTNGKKVIVVMPAYNAEKTVEKTFNAIPKDSYDEIILGDDCSSDNTVECARKLGITVIQHEKNKGYGGNQKTCYTAALNHGADIIAMVHPDFQYNPSLVPELVKPIAEGKADVTYGSRMLIRGAAEEGGMPLWKRLGNFALTVYMNTMLGTRLTDAATGFIVYNRRVLETIPFMRNDDGFCFDEEAIIQCADQKFRMVEIPIPVKYEPESSSIGVWKSIRYGWTLFGRVLRYRLHKIGIRSKLYTMKKKDPPITKIETTDNSIKTEKIEQNQ
jgi:glycosyltransferase involved in cell wall biosynthesis